MSVRFFTPVVILVQSRMVANYEVKLRAVIKKRREQCRKVNDRYHTATGFSLTIRRIDQVNRQATSLTDNDWNLFSMLKQTEELKFRLSAKLNAHEAYVTAGGTYRTRSVSRDRAKRAQQIRQWLKMVDPMLEGQQDRFQEQRLLKYGPTKFVYTDQGNNRGAPNAFPVEPKDLSEWEDSFYFDGDNELALFVADDLSDDEPDPAEIDELDE